MMKASVCALLCAVISTKMSIALAFPGLILLPLIEGTYLFVHHGFVFDNVIAACLLLYAIEVVGFFGAVLFLLSGHPTSVDK